MFCSARSALRRSCVSRRRSLCFFFLCQDVFTQLCFVDGYERRDDDQYELECDGSPRLFVVYHGRHVVDL